MQPPVPARAVQWRTEGRPAAVEVARIVVRAEVQVRGPDLGLEGSNSLQWISTQNSSQGTCRVYCYHSAQQKAQSY